jgi:hypothetical protein
MTMGAPERPTIMIAPEQVHRPSDVPPQGASIAVDRRRTADDLGREFRRQAALTGGPPDPRSADRQDGVGAGVRSRQGALS